MGVQGQYVATFSEGNIASIEGVHMNADYPHFFFDILGVMPKNKVQLRSHRDSSVWERPIRKDKSGHEYATIQQVSTYERIFKGGKPHTHKIYPVKGERL